MQSHRRGRGESACCNPGFFHHMQWDSHLPFLLQCGAALFPLGRGTPHQWSSCVTLLSHRGVCDRNKGVLFLWLLQYSWCNGWSSLSCHWFTRKIVQAFNVSFSSSSPGAQFRLPVNPGTYLEFSLKLGTDRIRSGSGLEVVIGWTGPPNDTA